MTALPGAGGNPRREGVAIASSMTGGRVTGRGGPGMMTGMDITGVYSPCTSAEHLSSLLCPSPQLRLPSGLLQ